jgi:hypothetical protein
MCQLELWVDIFPKMEGIPYPMPIAIDQRVPKSYQVRVIIWNTKVHPSPLRRPSLCIFSLQDVIFMDKNLAGQKMTDIYVRAFLRGMEDKRQKTDVHYRYTILSSPVPLALISVALL